MKRIRSQEIITTSLTAHQIHSIPWLALPDHATGRTSQTDAFKRLQLFHEFLYYVFDSMLIPLIRGHFYVTESNAHRYRLFYFRHDIWRSLAESSLASLKVSMLAEVKAEDAQKILKARTIGYSQLRLLPKETGVRPIMNLRRRTIKTGYKNMLGSSINSVLAPVFNMLTFEKASVNYK
jgi:telomerase reverse transcriptase